MPDERNKRGPLDNVQSIGKAALAVTAGAALLYRTGNSKALGDTIAKAGALMDSVADDVAGMALKDFDAKTINGLYDKHIKNANSTWKTLGDQLDGKIKLNQVGDNLISTIINKQRLLENPDQILRPKFDEQVMTDLMHNLGNQFNSTGDEMVQGKLNNFVRNTFKNLDDAVLFKNELGEFIANPEYVEQGLKGVGLDSQQQHQVMGEILQKIKDKKADYEVFKKANEELVGNISAKFNYEELSKKFGQLGDNNLTDKFLGDKRATLNDLIANEDKVTNNEFLINGQEEMKNIMHALKQMKSEDARFGNLHVDNLIRKNAEGEIYSLTPGGKVFDKVADEAANTLPGKLFKLRDALLPGQAPNWQYFTKGSSDTTLRALESSDKVLNNITQNDYVKVLDKVYKIKDNALEHVTELDNTYLTSGKHGTAPRLLKSITGDAERTVNSNKALNWLDIGNNTAPTKLKELSSIFTKFDKEKYGDRYGRSLMDSFLYADDIDALSLTTDPNYVRTNYNRIKNLDKFLGETTKQLDRSTIKKLKSVASGKTEDALNLLSLSDDDLIRELMENKKDLTTGLVKNKRDFKNPDLISLLNRYKKSPKGTLDSLKITSDKSMFFGETRPIKFQEMLRREIGKEAFIQQAESTGGRNSVNELFERAGVTGQALKESKFLANWGILQKESGLSTSNSRVPKDLKSMRQSILKTNELFLSKQKKGEYSVDGVFLESFRENMKLMSREKSSLTQKGFQKLDLNDADQLVQGKNYGDWMLMKKAISPIEAINDATKRKAFAKQFFAGRDNMKDVTTATLFPYFSLMRIVDPLSAVNLNFSTASTRSTMDLATNIMLKRVAPAAAGITALSYADYRAKAYTGTSLRGAAANSAARMDLGARKIADATGIGHLLNEDRKINPMSQYLFGKSYQDHEERTEWYDNGYSEVRKSRFWSFGSTSEFRGGKIDYFQHNYLKRAHSDWQDIGVYGSTKEKWAHSLMPTPRHPLAPLRYLADPYWLEKKNYWDRPYPVSGKMFSEGTPWGTILNPTLGEIIKPQKRLHKQELGSSLIDVRTLIAERNELIRNKANNDSGLVKIDSLGSYEPVSFTPLTRPNESEGNLNFKISGGRMQSMALGDPEYNAITMNDYDEMYNSYQSQIDSNYSSGSYNLPGEQSAPEIKGLSFSDKVKINAASGGIFSGMMTRLIPNEATASINYMNQNTYAKANQKQPAGVITSDSIFKTKASASSQLLSHKEALTDLRNVTSTTEFLQDAGYSAKQLSGMHGFLFEQLFPSQRKNRLQSAERMGSFSRRFWDAGVGGLGGEFMEIARRFFPHEDHNINRVNTIRNTMPDWMPDRFKFGDPYEQLPKGEMRFPGAGYEDINKLHSDQYGKYGAFDRMKILADIAPWSQEYKLWRDIASKTVLDPTVKDEIKKVKERVADQAKQHEFYPYKFLGTKFDEQSAVIDEIKGNTFSVVGSDKKYKLAGIGTVGTGEEGDQGILNYVQPGSQVRLQYDQNQYTRSNTDGSINALLYVDGENLNRKLLKSEVATERVDNSATGAQARLTKNQVDKGKVYEMLAHAPIPYFHDKFMRVNTPLESYKSEQIYGSSYSTWSHPIQGFLLPALQRAWSVGPTGQVLGMATWKLAEAVSSSGASSTSKFLANATYAATNRGAFIGGTLGFITKLGSPGTKNWMKWGSRAGSVAGLAGYAYTRLDNPVQSSFNFAALGYSVAKQLDVSGIGGGKGALIGAAVGVALSGQRNHLFDKDKMFGTYIPDRTRKKWDIEEYYDRLKYIKYTGLYEKAARKAKSKEDVDIKRILNKFDYDKKKREKIREQLLASQEKVRNTYAEGDQSREALSDEIAAKLSELDNPTATIRAGKYTKAALAYKQAAESTIYGLQDNATWAQILRALPKNERDYVLEFAKETDPKERKRILKHMSPYQKKALQIAWGEKADELENNRTYFANHKLPGMSWSGWQPGIDLDNVKIKTIENEGMMLSDLGEYESRLSSPEVQNAPVINNYNEGQGSIELTKNLLSSLRGAGLTGVDVSIEPSSASGIQVVANVARITDYQIKQKLNGVLGRVFY